MMGRLGKLDGDVHRKRKELENLKTVSCSPSGKSSLKMTRNRSRENELRNLGILEATDLTNGSWFLFPRGAWLGWRQWISHQACWRVWWASWMGLAAGSQGAQIPYRYSKTLEGRLQVMKSLNHVNAGLNFSLFFFNWSIVPGGSDDKESACNAADLGSIPGSGRSPGEWHGDPLQYSFLENSKDRGGWRATVHEVTKSQTWLSDCHAHSWFAMLR